MWNKGTQNCCCLWEKHAQIRKFWTEAHSYKNGNKSLRLKTIKTDFIFLEVWETNWKTEVWQVGWKNCFNKFATDHTEVVWWEFCAVVQSAKSVTVSDKILEIQNTSRSNFLKAQKLC